MRIGIPGKDCGACTMCCQVLDIPELKKPPGPLCPHGVPGGGCSIYARRPQVCRDFECDWLRDRELGPRLKPNLTGVILMEEAETERYLAVCHPDRPMDWMKNKLVFAHLVFMAKQGREVVAKAGEKGWRIYETGRWAPTG
jgi:hypothetical protein